MYCSNCGTQLRDNAKFCSNCGINTEGTDTHLKTSKSSSESLYKCPLCHKDDKTEKVSAIVDGGTFTGTTKEWISRDNGGYWSTVSVTQVSDLALILAPPLKPEYSPSCLWKGLPLVIAPWISIWFAPVSGRMKRITLLLIIILGIGLFGLFVFFSAINDSNIIDSEQIPGTMLAFVLLASFLSTPVFLVIYYVGLAKETANRRGYIEAVEIPRWRNAMKKWNELYYCARNDCVFFQGTEISSPKASMMDLINS